MRNQNFTPKSLYNSVKQQQLESKVAACGINGFATETAPVATITNE